MKNYRPTGLATQEFARVGDFRFDSEGTRRAKQILLPRKINESAEIVRISYPALQRYARPVETANPIFNAVECLVIHAGHMLPSTLRVACDWIRLAE